MIDRHSPVPIYFQIKEHIKEIINNKNLKAGDIIPSEREFAEQYRVSRMTVRQAIMDLVNEGTLIRLKGKGTFVSENKLEQPLQGLTSFTEDMRKRGLKPGSKLLKFELIPAPLEISQHLHIKEFDPVYEIKRIRLADDIPMALETNYLSANLVMGLTKEIVLESLYSYIETQLGTKIGYASQLLEATIAQEDEAKFLEIDRNNPVLLIHRQTFLDDGTPLEFVKSFYRADRYKFVVDLKRNNV